LSSFLQVLNSEIAGMKETELTYWYAVYTLPNFEKKVTAAIQQKGIVTYCPLQKQQRQWADRKKIIEVPAFKGYVFVNIHDEIRWKVLSTNGVLNFVCIGGKPARIPNHEIEAVQRFFKDMGTQSTNLELVPGNMVQINRGVLMGTTGKVVSVMHNYVTLQMPSLGLQMHLKVAVNDLKLTDADHLVA